MGRDGMKLRSNYIQYDLPRWMACCDNCSVCLSNKLSCDGRLLCSGGFILSALKLVKQCRFKTRKQLYSMWDLRLPQPCFCCCWGLGSSGMWRCVAEFLVTDLSKENNASIFENNASIFENNASIFKGQRDQVLHFIPLFTSYFL